MDTKICKDCSKLLPVNEYRFRILPRKNNVLGYKYIVPRCKKCESVYNKLHMDKEKRKLAERKRFSSSEAKGKKNAYQKKWREKNLVLNRQYQSKHIKKQVDTLSDSYVKRSLFKTKTFIPKELVEIKRLQLKLSRTIKEKING